MKVFTIVLWVLLVFPPAIKSQTSHPKRNNYVKLFKDGEIVGEGVLYELTDSAFILYDDNRISRHDTVVDKTLLKSFSFHQVQLARINPGNGVSGLLICGFIGGAAGSVAGFAIANMGTNDESSIERSHDQLVGFVIGFIIGGIVGAIPGYIHGNKQRMQVWINYDYSNFSSQKDKMKPFCFRK